MCWDCWLNRHFPRKATGFQFPFNGNPLWFGRLQQVIPEDNDDDDDDHDDDDDDDDGVRRIYLRRIYLQSYFSDVTGSIQDPIAVPGPCEVT